MKLRSVALFATILIGTVSSGQVGEGGANSAGPNGHSLGCLRFKADRQARLAQCARPISPRTDQTPFTFRFRFRTLGPHAYGALVFVGLRAAGAGFKQNGAGVILHRHSAKHGLLGYPFVADAKNRLHVEKVTYVQLQYETVYDVVCTWTPDTRTLTATFRRLDGEVFQGKPLRLPPEAHWHADSLAVWNYADGNPRVRNSASLTVLLDDLQLDAGPVMTFDRDISDMPRRTGAGAAWTQAPRVPLFSGLDGPRDVYPGDDARFRVRLRPGARIAGVEFQLRRFSGVLLLRRPATLAGNTAHVVFPADALASLPRGEALLAVTAPGESARTGRSVYLHGRVFRDVLTEPEGMQAGDEIVIGNMGLCDLPGGVRRHSVEGVWWRRAYRETGDDPGGARREMLCVEDCDPAAPERCLAPPFRLPLRLHGWYDIWVTTYRPERGGGIDVRLSGEPYYRHLDPWEVETAGSGKPGSRLVEIRFRACDLSGQELVFQQPYGTFESEYKLCNASLAGVRLVKLSEHDVTRVRAEFADPANRRIGFDNDGYSYFWKWGTHDPACIARLFEPLRTPSVSFLNLSIGGLGGLIIPTPYTELYQLQGHTRYGDFRANAFFRWCAKHDVNIVHVLAQRAHAVGKKLFVSTMMERCYSPDRFVRDHPRWRVTRGRGVWDYANPQVRDFQTRKIAWICAHHDIDGFIVDFTRYGHFFNRDEPRKFAHMNTFVRGLRKALDRVNAAKTRKVLLCASFGDRSWHLLHWGTGTLEDQGLDVRTWIREGIFDILMPEGPTCLDVVELAKGSRTRVWPRKVETVPLESSKDANGKLGPVRITRTVAHAFDRGADGIFFFNHEPWTSFGRLGIRKELTWRGLADTGYGVREGPRIEFTEWFPGFDARERQRRTFAPVAVETRKGAVEGAVRVPVVNTFDHAVHVRVRWGGDAIGKGPRIEPVEAAARFQPGERAELTARMKGTVPEALRAAGLYADLTFRAGETVVFRHRLPARLTPGCVCELRKAGSPEFRALGDAGGTGGAVQVAATKDALLVRCVWGRIGKLRTPHKHDDFRAVESGPHLEVLIDTDGREQSFFQFLANPTGDRAEAVWQYSSFQGRPVRKPEWNGNWTVQTGPADADVAGGTRLTVSLPFKTLGRRPESGARWRLAVSVSPVDGAPFHWPSAHRRDPARFGLLRFR